MHKVTIKTILLIAGFVVCGVATAGGRGTPTPLPPMIVKIAVDAQEKVLIITGRNFGLTLPTVMLADQALDVKRFSEREVVVSLPRGLTSATYGVIVTASGRNRASSNLFSTTFSSLAFCLKPTHLTFAFSAAVAVGAESRSNATPNPTWLYVA